MDKPLFKFRPGKTTALRLPDTFPPYDQALQFAELSGWLEALRIIPFDALEWQCLPTWKLGPRIIQNSMFFIFNNGHGRGFVGDQHFEIQAGDMILIPKGVLHFVEQGEGVAFHQYGAHFHANVFGGINILELLGFPAHIRLQKGRDDLVCILARQLIREYALQAPGYVQIMAAALLEILMHLIRHFGPDFRPRHVTPRTNELRRLLPAFDHVERNLAKGPISVSTMAKKTFVGERQFRNLFRGVTGMSPVRYVQARRIDHACRALMETDMPVEQVALAAGFSNAPFFCRVFKKVTQTTPAQYRLTSHGRQ